MSTIDVNDEGDVLSVRTLDYDGQSVDQQDSGEEDELDDYFDEVVDESNEVSD